MGCLGVHGLLATLSSVNHSESPNPVYAIYFSRFVRTRRHRREVDNVAVVAVNVQPLKHTHQHAQQFACIWNYLEMEYTGRTIGTLSLVDY